MMILNWLYEIRSYLTSYGQYIRYRWLISLIWAVALAAMIWFYGAELSFGTWHPFEAQRTRLIAVIVIAAIWLVYIIVKLVRARQAERSLIDAVTADGKADPARAAAEDLAELRARLKDALKTLRQTLGRGSAYQLPWYLLIGAPGAGKTTALVNSGLHFPLAGEAGPHPVQGVAGTRHCDWWFTDEGILIDTAGRYTTQDGEQETDRAGWQGFLKLLRHHRRRQPLNGALVMLGLDDIMNAEPAERLRQARVIRKRLRELDETFKLRVPSYVVLTKADRLAGFSAFFENMDKTSREQVWGVTLPLPESGIEGSDLADRFSGAFDALVERLNALLLDRLQSEPDSERRAEIFAFPTQVALLAEPLHEILAEIAAASRFDPPPRIRGIYLASAQQDQAPLDLVTRAAISHFGVDLPRLAAATLPGGKSFFLARLLREVVFGEASLISTDPRRARRNRIIRWTGVATIGIVALCLSLWWATDYFHQEEKLAAIEANVSAYRPIADTIPVKNVNDRDFVRVAQVLDQVRTIDAGYQEEKGRRFGLPSQTDKVTSGYKGLYTRALNDFLLPRLLLQVEADMRQKPEVASYVMDSVRIYPMLGSRTTVDAAFVRKKLADDMLRILPGDDKAGVRASLDRHVAALIAGPLTPIALDDTLITEALANERSREQFVKWQTRGGALCTSALTGRYPFAKTSTVDMTTEDFVALFGPSGAFDKFFKDELQAKVDVTTSPWKWKTVAGQPPRSADGLRSFERADAIRVAFFSTGTTPFIAFDVMPRGLEGATGATLTSDGQQVSVAQNAKGAVRPVALTWPGQIGIKGADFEFQPSESGESIYRRGPWALFRLLDAGRLQPFGADRIRAEFGTGARTASFEFRVETPSNPFDLAALRAFRCPETL